MAMSFYRAERAQAPDMVTAVSEQARLEQQARNAEQLRRQGNLQGSIGAGQLAHEMGAFEGMLGGGGATGAAPIVEAVPTMGLEGEIVSGLAQEAAAMDALAGTAAGTAGTAGTAGAAGAGAAGAAGAGAAGAAGSGAAAAGMASNPVGWAIMGALALNALL